MEGEGVKLVSLSQQLTKYRYALGVLALGAVLMLLPSPQKTESAEPTGDPFDRLAVQREMEQILSKVDGAGALKLMLSVSSGSELELASDESAQQEEGRAVRERKPLVLDSGSSERVVVTKSCYPGYTGALIVCEGAGNAAVRLSLTQAVSSLTGLTADKITVVKGKP